MLGSARSGRVVDPPPALQAVLNERKNQQGADRASDVRARERVREEHGSEGV